MEHEIPIDLSYFYSITNGNKSFEKKLLSVTVADIDSMVMGLSEAWESADPEGIRANAHSLISLSAIGGMPEVEKWCRTIEKAFMDGVFHPELSTIADNIIYGWPGAHSKLNAVIKDQ